MIVAIHQPQYLPWLGYFDKIRQADVFCFLDNVQFKKNEWQNRNRIKTAGGWQWLTVPVAYRFPQRINEVSVNNATKWGKKHLQALVTNYGKSPFFNDYIGFFETLYAKSWESISELNCCAIKEICVLSGITDKSFVTATDFSLSDDPTGRLVDICKAVGGDTYLSGRDGAKYMQLDRFAENGIDVIFQEFKHPVYPQLYGDFQANLSFVDLLFNCGPQSIKTITENN
jgi:hypothetical protein